MDIPKIRAHFPAIQAGRTLTNNAATTQTTRELLELWRVLAVDYDNVHRGQSASSRKMTALFENAHRTIADFIGAELEEVILYRNNTEAINAVMYMLLGEFRDGDNIVATRLEHNSNFIPWHAATREILPRFGRKVELRLAGFDGETGELDLEHLGSLVDGKTKLICCTGASNFLGTKTPLGAVKEIAAASGYRQPDGQQGSYFLVDGCQVVPHGYSDVKAVGMDFLTWSFHKMLAPFGVGGLYARKELLLRLPPFLYGGDMIAEGRVSAESVDYNRLPWKYSAGTPDIMGTILSAEALKVILDLVLNPGAGRPFPGPFRLGRSTVEKAMGEIAAYEEEMSAVALAEFQAADRVHLFGPKDARKRVPLFSFVGRGRSPREIARALNEHGIEARAGCHCASLAHREYGLGTTGSCRLSYYFYNTLDEVRDTVRAVRDICSR